MRTTGRSIRAEARHATDRNDTDKSYGAAVTVKQGPGVYTLLVLHSGTGADQYGISYHCETATNTHTGTTIVSRQQE